MAFSPPSSPSDSDDPGLDKDLEAVRRACQTVGTNPDDFLKNITTTNPTASFDSDSSSDDDDLALVRSILDKYSLQSDQSEPLSLQPLKTLLPGFSDDEEDDFETLRAIERRCAQYESNSTATTTTTTTARVIATAAATANASASANDDCNTNGQLEEEIPPVFDADIPLEHLELPEVSGSGSTYPQAANFFVDAIRKNRHYQKTVREKLVKIEALMEQNKEHKKRVKLLRDFQISCKRKTSNALSQKRDPRVQLISLPRSRKSAVPKGGDKKTKVKLLGPVANSHVPNYRMVLEKYPVGLYRETWSDNEKENLKKGIKQQFQEALLEKTMEHHSGTEEGVMDLNNFDDAIAPISDCEVLPEDVRAFLPKVNWERLASMYVEGRSGEECEARWLNCEDPLINCNPWTKGEDKKLLYVIQQRGVHNWIGIAAMLRTNRTPFQCVSRYQRSLNAQMIKREWNKEDDTQLFAAVQVFGDNNWQPIACCFEGRTGQQCANRWQKTLNPDRRKVGRWDVEEDKYLKVAVTLFGARAWNKIAQFVTGRTQVQCRERWLNVLDPSLNLEPWTRDEDSKLLAAIKEHGNCWSKIAAYVPPRTDNQCRRRWKVLRPREDSLRQAALKLEKSALMSNFVDRKKDRPELGASDFIPPPELAAILGAGSGSSIMNEKKKTQKRCNSKNQSDEKRTDVASSEVVPKRRKPKRSTTKSQTLLDEEEDRDLENFGEVDTLPKKKRICKSNRCPEPASSSQKLSQPSGHSTGTNATNDGTFSEGDATPTSEVAPKRRNLKRSTTKSHTLRDEEEDYDLKNFSEVDTVPKKKRVRKSNRCPEPAPNSQELSQPSGDSTGTNATNDGTLGEKNAIPKRKKGAKSSSKRKGCMEPALSDKHLPLSPEIALGDQHLSLSPEPLTITNGHDTFQGGNRKKKRKMTARKMSGPCLKKAKRSEPAERRKMTARKMSGPCLKKAKCSEPAQSEKDLLLSPDPSKIENGVNTESVDGDEVPKMPSGSNGCTESAEVQESPLLYPEELAGSCITSCSSHENIPKVSIIPKKRKASKLHSKRKRLTEPAEEHDDFPSSSPDLSIPTNISNCNAVEPVGGVHATSKRKQVPNRRLTGYLMFPVRSIPPEGTACSRNEAFDGDNNSPKEKQAPKSRAEKDRCNEPAQEERDVPLPLRTVEA